MILIPQRLFHSPQVKTLLRDGNTCFLQKHLTEAVEQREGYISTHVISMVISGTQRIETYDGEWFAVQAGEAVCIPRGLYYITDLLPSSGVFESILCYFEERHLAPFLAKSQPEPIQASHLKLSITAEVFSFIQHLSLSPEPSPANPHQINTHIHTFLRLFQENSPHANLSSFFHRLSSPNRRSIQPFMEQHFDKPLSVADFAYLTGRSLSTFRRDFKAQFDLPPKQWLKRQRLHKAKDLIETSPIRVQHLAEHIGYVNTSYFIREFRQAFGLSPKQYQIQIAHNASK